MISSGLFVLPELPLLSPDRPSLLHTPWPRYCTFRYWRQKWNWATAMPRSGAAYFHTGRSMGLLAGTVAGFCNWAALSLKTTFAMVGLGALAYVFYPEGGVFIMKATAAGSCILFLIINIIGTREVGRLQILLVFALLGILGVIAYWASPKYKANVIWILRHRDGVPRCWQSNDIRFLWRSDRRSRCF